jgi:hypothetical protein
MSLGIGILIEGTRPSRFEPDWLAMEDDGYYWFMYPFFERLSAATGQMVDPYGGAEFHGATLDALRRTLAEARDAVSAMPEQWQVQTGTSLGSVIAPTPPTPVLETVARETFLNLLAAFGALAARADRDGRRLVCIGD